MGFLISKALKDRLTKLECLLAGFTLWSFFILSPIYVCYALNINVRNLIFLIILSSVILSISSIVFLYKKIFSPHKITVHRSTVLLIASAALLIGSMSVVQLLTPLLFNWDAVSIYLPLAREISSTGFYHGMNYGTIYASAALPFRDPPYILSTIFNA